MLDNSSTSSPFSASGFECVNELVVKRLFLRHKFVAFMLKTVGPTKWPLAEISLIAFPSRYILPCS